MSYITAKENDGFVLCYALSLSHIQLFVTPWTIAYQAALSMGFSRQEYWSGLPCPPPGELPSLGIEPRPPALQADSLSSETQSWVVIFLREFLANVSAMFGFREQHNGDLDSLSEPTMLRNID